MADNESDGPRAPVRTDDISAGHSAQDDDRGNVEAPRIPAGLRPFAPGDPRAIAAGRRGAEVRRARRAVDRARTLDVAAELRTLASTYEGASLGDVAASAALDMIGRVQRGEIAPRDPADWVRVLVDIARLERGQPTSTSLVAHIGTADSAARLAALQTTARETLSRVNGDSLSALTEVTADEDSHDEDEQADEQADHPR